MIVVIAGASGLVGSELVRALHRSGHQPRLLVRRTPVGPGEFGWDPTRHEIDERAFAGADAVVNLAGSPVAARWTSQGREEILRSRLDSADTIVAAVLASRSRPRVVIQASAIGYYGNTGRETADESAPQGPGFLADVVRQWEHAVHPLGDVGIRTVTVRSGIVFSGHGGALGRLLPLIRCGLGGPLGSGRQWWSWITLTDEVRAIMHLLDSTVAGPVNLVTPHASRQRDVVGALAHAMDRPAALPVPAMALRLAVGGFADEILQSQRVAPSVLERDGFVFAHGMLNEAARWVCHQYARTP